MADGRHPNKKDIALSKTLSYLLRHGATKEHLAIAADGFIPLADLLRHRQLRGVSEADVRRIVETNDKKRFLLAEGPPLKIKATQGHSMPEVQELTLQPIRNATDAPLVVHGTFYRFWERIKVEGLRRMARNHIHFACTDQIKGGTTAISGFRSSCEVLIYIDLPKAIAAGMEFFRSENGVILTAGLEGCVMPRFFRKVVDRKRGVELEVREKLTI